MAVKKIIYRGSDKFKIRISEVLNDIIDSGAGGVKVVDNLKSTSKIDALSANMGRELNDTKADKTDLMPFKIVDGKICVTFEM